MPDRLEPFRPYLTVLARAHLPRKLWRKIDPAEVVQQAMLQAVAALSAADGPVLTAAWLRAVLANALTDATRRFGAAKRDAGRERSLEADLDQSAAGLAGLLSSGHTSPSAAAVRNEDLSRLATAMETLPPLTGQIVALKYLNGWPVARIAKDLDKTEASVAGHLRRGLEALRETLGQP